MPKRDKCVGDRIRFWSKVNKKGPVVYQNIGPCWLWTASVSGGGYGQFIAHGKLIVASRYSWEIHYGIIPDGMLVCHHCDTPSCVNPSHLFLGTELDNKRDMKEKGRSAHGERNGTKTHPESRPRGKDHWSSRMPELRVKGEDHGQAILTEDIVWEILTSHIRRRSSKYSPTSLARKYRVARSTVSDIIFGKTWRHVYNQWVEEGKRSIHKTTVQK